MKTTTKDIVSYLGKKGQPFKLYARKGDKVEIIENRGNVSIAQKGSEKFTVKNEDLL